MKRIRAVIIPIICVMMVVFVKKYNTKSTIHIEETVLPTLVIEQDATPKLKAMKKTSEKVTKKVTKKSKFKTGYIKAGNVNVRKKPSGNKRVKKVLYLNEKVKYRNCEKEKWVEIKTKNTKGYILKKYISNKKPKQQVFSNIPNSKLWSYMDYRCITSVSSAQHKLQRRAYTGIYGIRQVNGRYCIAVGSYFTTKIGVKIDLILSNGTIVRCILADCKADRDTDWKNQKTSDGSLVEVVVDTPNLHGTARRMGDIRYCNSKWKSKIKQIIVYK